MRPIKSVVSILIAIAFAHTISAGAPNGTIVYEEITRLDAADQLARARCEVYSCFSTVEQMVSGWCPNPQICDAYVLQGRELAYFQWCLAQTLQNGLIPTGCPPILFPEQLATATTSQFYPLCSDYDCDLSACSADSLYCECDLPTGPFTCARSLIPCAYAECVDVACPVASFSTCVCTRVDDGVRTFCSRGEVPTESIVAMKGPVDPIQYPLCGDLRCTVTTCNDATVPYCLCEVDGVPPKRCVESYPPCYNLECHTLSCDPMTGACLCTRENASPVICSSGSPMSDA